MKWSVISMHVLNLAILFKASEVKMDNIMYKELHQFKLKRVFSYGHVCIKHTKKHFIHKTIGYLISSTVFT